MRRALGFIAIISGIVSIVSAVVLGCIYLEDFFGYIKRIKARITSIVSFKKPVD